MSNINIEVLEKRVLRLGTKPNGDLEIIVSHLSGLLGEKGEYKFINQVVAIIPQNRREFLSEFIKNAP